MTKNEVETRNFLRGWIKCSDEPNHYPTDDMEVVIIAYYNESKKEWEYYAYEDSPYEWDVLCKGQAYWMKECLPPYVYDETTI